MFTDFELSTTPVNAPYVRYLRGRKLPLFDRCRAGLAFNDASQGLNVQDWVGELRGGRVWFTPDLTGVAIAGYDYGFSSTDLTIAFDSNMQPASCIRNEAGDGFLFRWYDATVSNFTIFPINNCRDAMIRIDEVRAGYETNRDIILSYIRADNMLCFRQTRDRFTIEYELTPVHEWQRLYQCGMNMQYRFQWDLVWDPLRMDGGYHG